MGTVAGIMNRIASNAESSPSAGFDRDREGSADQNRRGEQQGFHSSTVVCFQMVRACAASPVGYLNFSSFSPTGTKVLGGGRMRGRVLRAGLYVAEISHATSMKMVVLWMA